MSRILRRPMFRGGSTSNEGIMSVPRKGYEKAGSVDSEFDFGFLGDDRQTSGLRNVSNDYYGSFLGNNDNMFGLGLSTKEGDTGGTDKDTVLNKGIIKEKLVEGDVAEELGLSPMGKRLRQRYLSQRSDPLGKFLINFGLNYMSARPRGGKFGALATAADAAKKPTEQLYADIDTDRLLKLKLMTALGKGESKGAFEKKVNFIWDSEQGKIKSGRPSTFKSKEEVVDYLRKQESETKSQSVEDQVNADASKRVEANKAPNMKIAKSMAYFDLFGMEKIPKNEANALANNYFLPPRSLSPKPNSTDFELSGDEVKNLESKIGKLKSGQTYVEPSKQQVFLYVGNNAFRPLSKY